MLHLPHTTSVFKVGVIIELNRSGFGLLQRFHAGPIIRIQVAGQELGRFLSLGPDMIAICLPPYVRPTPASLIQSRFRTGEGIKKMRRADGIIQVGEALCSQVATKSGSVKAGMLTERGHHRLPQQIKRLK